MKTICSNPKARHEYIILDTIECGIVLYGTEIKSIRQGHVNIKDSFALIKNGEVFIHNMHISPYDKGNINNKDPLRTRKLLLKKSEILNLSLELKKQSLTLIPISLYFNGNLVKLELGLAKGKKLYDKRQDIAKRETEVRLNKLMKQNTR
ncbi:MAG: SsrA-binding protein SmpB [Clostridiales bacterium]|nr:SsrA-binding protein SmpB [Clostridiales bacterium]